MTLRRLRLAVHRLGRRRARRRGCWRSPSRRCGCSHRQYIEKCCPAGGPLPSPARSAWWGRGRGCYRIRHFRRDALRPPIPNPSPPCFAWGRGAHRPRRFTCAAAGLNGGAPADLASRSRAGVSSRRSGRKPDENADFCRPAVDGERARACRHVRLRLQRRGRQYRDVHAARGRLAPAGRARRRPPRS